MDALELCFFGIIKWLQGERREGRETLLEWLLDKYKHSTKIDQHASQ